MDSDSFWKWFDRVELPHGPVDSATRVCTETTVFISSQGQRIFTTRKGYIGIAPSKTELGEGIFMLAGSNMPMALWRENRTHTLLVGDSRCVTHLSVHVIYTVSWMEKQ